jgi:hypothetical protein
MSEKNGILRVGFYKDGYQLKAGDSIKVTKELLDKGYFVKGTKLPEKPKKTKTKKTESKTEE